MIIATFIKLLDINIVANNLFGFFNNFLIFFSFLSSILDKSSKFWELNEKKDTSEPEIRADKKIRTKITNIYNTKSMGISFTSNKIVFNNMGRGSSFKIYNLKWQIIISIFFSLLRNICRGRSGSFCIIWF